MYSRQYAKTEQKPEPAQEKKRPWVAIPCDCCGGSGMVRAKKSFNGVPYLFAFRCESCANADGMGLSEVVPRFRDGQGFELVRHDSKERGMK